MWIGTVHLYVVDMQYGYLFYNCAGKGREQTQSKGSIMLLSFYTSLKSGSNDLHEVHAWEQCLIYSTPTTQYKVITNSKMDLTITVLVLKRQYFMFAVCLITVLCSI